MCIYGHPIESASIILRFGILMSCWYWRGVTSRSILNLLIDFVVCCLYMCICSHPIDFTVSMVLVFLWPSDILGGVTSRSFLNLLIDFVVCCLYICFCGHHLFLY